jgi:LysM repeat protein
LFLAVILAVIFGPHFFNNSGGSAPETLPRAEAAREPKQAAPRLAAEAGLQPKPNTPAVEPTPAESETEIGERLAEAMVLVNTRPNKVIEARDKLNDLLATDLMPHQRTSVKEQLSKLADRWLFSRTVYPGDRLCGRYRVVSGDQLRIIGKKHKVPYQILMRINKIHRPQDLKAGQTIKVIHGPFHAKVYRSVFTMDLFLQNTYVRSFPVGLGKAGYETPTGLWRVEPEGKLISPTWTDPDTQRTYRAEDPDYPLGSRWIALEGLEGQAEGRTGFAIHGTKDPDQIGTPGSRGCIRLHNGDAILVYSLLVPIHSRVRVVE